jgi:hypothetical protein
MGSFLDIPATVATIDASFAAIVDISRAKNHSQEKHSPWLPMFFQAHLDFPKDLGVYLRIPGSLSYARPDYSWIHAAD